MDHTLIHLVRVCPAPVEQVSEARWESIEDAIREALDAGIEQFILDLHGAAEIHPLDYWMLLNLAILIPAGGLAVVCEEAIFARSIAAGKLTKLIPCVASLEEAYAELTGLAEALAEVTIEPNHATLLPDLRMLEDSRASSPDPRARL